MEEAMKFSVQVKILAIYMYVLSMNKVNSQIRLRKNCNIAMKVSIIG